MPCWARQQGAGKHHPAARMVALPAIFCESPNGGEVYRAKKRGVIPPGAPGGRASYSDPNQAAAPERAS